MSKTTLYNYDPLSPTLIEDELYSNVGNEAFQLGDVKRAFSETDFEIQEDDTSGAVLIKDVDYELTEKDTFYTTEAGYDVWTGVKILNVAYQSTDLLITYNTIGSYTDATTQNDILTEISLLGVNSLVLTDSYTILDDDNYNYIYCDTISNVITVTLPTLADNQNRELTILHSEDGSNEVIVTAEGAETIDGLNSIELPKLYNRMKIIATSDGWKILDENITCQLRLTNYVGYGSTDIKIIQFASVLENTGNVFSENHTTGYNSGAEGLEITIEKAGKYSFTFTTFTVGSDNGISLNSSQLTTDFYAINVADKLNSIFMAAGGIDTGCSWTGYLDVGDVVRPHTRGASSTSDSTYFTATYIGV